jgi:hypothetical protein
VRYGPAMDDDRPDSRTDAQREWADWAAHGYAKRYQPRSMLWLGGVFLVVFGVALVAVVWLIANDHWP